MLNEGDSRSTTLDTSPNQPPPYQPGASIFSAFGQFQRGDAKQSTALDNGSSERPEKPTSDTVGGCRPSQRLLQNATVKLAEFYKNCRGDFTYLPGLNPRRCLTNPAESEPGSCDNAEGDYVLYVNQVLVSTSTGKRYTILDKVGQGTFGQVAKCRTDDGSQLAIKIVRSKPAYTNQALVEHMILSQLNGENRCKYIVKYYECFMHQNHLCLVFELLAVNLYDLLRQNTFKGLSLNLIRVIVRQCLEALVAIGDKNIVHCDLKPENIMLQSTTSPQIKVIDFGSACMEHQAVYTYIQSRFYRSPEVLLRLSYARGVDIWSLACIGAELFLGLPLWPGTSEFNQMAKMVESLGLPPVEMLDRAKWTLKFFNRIEMDGGGHTYELKTAAQFEEENMCVLPPERRYFRYSKVEELVQHYPYKKGLSAEERDKEAAMRLKYAHLLNGILQYDPQRRWTARQCLEHPFLTSAPHDPSWKPPLLPADRPVTVPVSRAKPPRHSQHTPPVSPAHAPQPAPSLYPPSPPCPRPPLSSSSGGGAAPGHSRGLSRTPAGASGGGPSGGGASGLGWEGSTPPSRCRLPPAPPAPVPPLLLASPTPTPPPESPA